ncbi:hypothetical protein [Burkholderia pseudomallei]|uniref:hypothetical protein n=1 Tax=Burkholderia pseudomallei TaxID=28450 RepID=UPI000F04B2DF|nr:hypothetical protein [Burkholderia pseudomallei]
MGGLGETSPDNLAALAGLSIRATAHLIRLTVRLKADVPGDAALGPEQGFARHEVEASVGFIVSTHVRSWTAMWMV